MTARKKKRQQATQTRTASGKRKGGICSAPLNQAEPLLSVLGNGCPSGTGRGTACRVAFSRNWSAWRAVKRSTPRGSGGPVLGNDLEHGQRLLHGDVRSRVTGDGEEVDRASPTGRDLLVASS